MQKLEDHIERNDAIVDVVGFSRGAASCPIVSDTGELRGTFGART